MQVAAPSFQAGAAPPDFARAPNATSAGRAVSMWLASATDVGTRWHSPHATGTLSPPAAFRCDWWAPTDLNAVDVPPAVSTGGAALSTLP